MTRKRFSGRYGGLVGVAVFAGVLMGISQLTGLREHVNLTYLRQTLADHQGGGLLAFVLLFSLGNLVQIPGWLFLASAVFVLGPVAGGVVTYISAVTSCAITFLTVGFIGGDALRQLNSPVATRLLDHLQAHPVRNIVMLRTLFQTLPALNYALALSGTGWRNYMAGTVLGLPLPIAIYCLLFDSLSAWVSAAAHKGGYW